MWNLDNSFLKSRLVTWSNTSSNRRRGSDEMKISVCILWLSGCHWLLFGKNTIWHRMIIRVVYEVWMRACFLSLSDFLWTKMLFMMWSFISWGRSNTLCTIYSNFISTVQKSTHMLTTLYNYSLAFHRSGKKKKKQTLGQTVLCGCVWGCKRLHAFTQTCSLPNEK